MRTQTIQFKKWISADIALIKDNVQMASKYKESQHSLSLENDKLK
jgi:hypothetical protein